MSIPRQIPYGIQAENGTTSKSRTQPASQIRVCFAGAALESEPSGAIPARLMHQQGVCNIPQH